MFDRCFTFFLQEGECFMADELKPSADVQAQAQGQQPQQVQIPVDINSMLSGYTNFFRVTGTPEELVLDFGLNTQQMTPSGPETIKLTHRLVMSFYTAKRLLNAMHWAVNRYETHYGVLETDFQKRMRTQAPSAPAGRAPGYGS
jgi:hypothetical protein